MMLTMVKRLESITFAIFSTYRHVDSGLKSLSVSYSVQQRQQLEVGVNVGDKVDKCVGHHMTLAKPSNFQGGDVQLYRVSE